MAGCPAPRGALRPGFAPPQRDFLRWPGREIFKTPSGAALLCEEIFPECSATTQRLRRPRCRSWASRCHTEPCSGPSGSFSTPCAMAAALCLQLLSAVPGVPLSPAVPGVEPGRPAAAAGGYEDSCVSRASPSSQPPRVSEGSQTPCVSQRHHHRLLSLNPVFHFYFQTLLQNAGGVQAGCHTPPESPGALLRRGPGVCGVRRRGGQTSICWVLGAEPGPCVRPGLTVPPSAEPQRPHFPGVKP